MEYRVLGPLEVVGDDGPLPLGGTKQRELLALLVLNANRVVSRDRLIDGLWGDDPPETAVTSVQVYVSRLRKVLPHGALVTQPPGYLLAADPESIDLRLFEKRVGEARRAEPEQAARLLRDALALWRGPPLHDLGLGSGGRGESGRLEELRLSALEDRLDADLALGRHTEVIGELQGLIDEHPHRERLRAQLMLALYRSGRQAEALEAYRDARHVLVDTLGIDPSDELRLLEQQILAQDEALTAARPLLARQVPLPGPLRVASPFPFVGRENELDALRSLLTIAESGEGGRIALISGEAGGGKTRLARELAREASERGALVLFGSSNAEVNIPYQPFVEAIEFLQRNSDPAAFEALVGERRRDLALVIPELGAPADVRGGDPETARRRLHTAVAGLFDSVSRRRTLVLVLDDVHWADSGSVHLLRDISRIAAEGRMLVLATYRDRTEDLRPELASAIAALVRADGVTRMRAEPLTAGEIGELIARSSGAVPSSELTDAIGSLTDGTPFLVCELWRALIDTEAVDIANAEARLTRPVAELNSPESVRDVVRYRISRLSRQTQAMLEVAAVAGPSFELSVLGDKPAAAAAAEESIASGMIEEAAEPGLAYRFAHELFRRALYDRLTSVRRAELHVRVGEIMEREHAGNLGPILADLAHHFTIGVSLGGVERAVDYNLRAAEAAMTSLAFDQALANVHAAIELGLDGRVGDVACDLALALMDDGDLERAEQLVSTGIAEARRRHDAETEAHLAVARGHGLMRTHAASESEIQRIAETSLGTLTRSRHERGQAHAARLLSLVHLVQCEWQRAEEMLWIALDHAKAVGDRREEIAIAGWLAGALYHGPTSTDVAIPRYESLLHDFGEDPVARARIECHLAGVRAMRGEFDEAIELAHHSCSTLDRVGSRVLAASARIVTSEVDALAGNADATIQRLMQAHEVLERAGERAVTLEAVVELAGRLCDVGCYAEAEEWMAPVRGSLDGADVMVRSIGLAAEAKLAEHRSDLESAVSFARRAVAAVESTDAVNRHASALATLSAVLGCARRDEEGRRARDEAVALFESKGNRVAADQTRSGVAASSNRRSTTARSSARRTPGAT